MLMMFVLVYFYLVKYQFNNKCRLYIQYNCTIAIHYNFFTQNAKEQNLNFWHGCELLQTHLDMNNFSNFFQNSIWLYIELTFWIIFEDEFQVWASGFDQFLKWFFFSLTKLLQFFMLNACSNTTSTSKYLFSIRFKETALEVLPCIWEI